MEKHLRNVRNVDIGQKALSGMSQAKIAKDVGLTETHVSRILQKDEIQTIIEQGAADMIDLVPDAVDVHKRCLKMIKGKDKDPKIAQSSATTVLKTTGIIPSHTQININKLFNQDNSTKVTQIAGIQEFMAWKFSPDNPANAIDVTPDEGKDES